MPATETATGTTPRGRSRARTRAAEPAAPPPAAPPESAAPGTGATPPAPASPAAGAAHEIQQPSATAPAQEGGPRERWLAAARRRFEGDPEKEPITGDQLTYLLDLLHEDGKDRRLVSETYGYLDRGMSKAHASMQIRKLRGEFVERRPAAA